MLVIRPQQMHAFERESERSFIETVVRRLAIEFPVHFAAIGDAGLARAVKEALEWGPKVGIRTEGAIAVLAELLLVYGPELRDSPDRAWAMQILISPSMLGQLKVRLLRDQMDAKSQGRMIVKTSVER